MADDDLLKMAVEDPAMFAKLNKFFEERATIHIDGEEINPTTDLTFREQRQYKAIIRDELGADPDEASDSEFLPAVLCVVRRRTNPDYTLDEALAVKPSELLKPEKKNGSRRPTKAKA